AFDEATADLNMPGGFMVKQHGETANLTEGILEVVDWETISYSQAAIDPQQFEVPEGWKRTEGLWGSLGAGGAPGIPAAGGGD
ncbi:MAG: hypothetical protein J7M38_03575, partial [Armatimonadetes bacterium]|nr:hypothetical protein [Armatimonadota bacterium]